MPKNHVAENFVKEQKEKEARAEKEEARRQERILQERSAAAAATQSREEAKKSKADKRAAESDEAPKKKKKVAQSESLHASSSEEDSGDGDRPASSNKKKLLNGKKVNRAAITGRAKFEMSTVNNSIDLYPDQSQDEAESSYLFDHKAHYANINSTIGSYAGDTNSGAEILISSLLLSPYNANEALDGLFNGTPRDAYDASRAQRNVDKHNQRALLFRLYNWINPSHQHHSDVVSSNLSIVTRTIQELITKIPSSFPDAVTMCDRSHEEACPANDERLSELCKIITEFLDSRVIPLSLLTNGSSAFASAGTAAPSLASSTMSVDGDATPVADETAAEKPYTECTLEDLIAMKPRIPLSFHQYLIASRLTYGRLAGDRKTFEGSGGGGKSNESEGDTTFQYGGMNENFVQEMVERSCMGKDSSFYDVGSGIGQVVIQVAATVGCKAEGVEYLVDRHNHAVKLMAGFVETLEMAGVIGVEYFKTLVTLECGDFVTKNTTFSQFSVVFFNNYGPYFDTQQPQSLNHYFSEQVGFFNVGSQVLRL